MADMLITWHGDAVGGTYTLSAPEYPIGATVAIGADNFLRTLAAFDDMRAIGRDADDFQFSTMPSVPAAAQIDHTGGSILVFVDPDAFGSTVNEQFFELLSAGGTTSISNGGISIRNSSADALQILTAWAGYGAEGLYATTWPTTAFYIWIRLDPSNATSTARMQLKIWDWNGTPPVDFTNVNVPGAAATAINFDPLDYMRFFGYEETNLPMSIGTVVVSTNPDEDMTAFLPGAPPPAAPTHPFTSVSISV